MEQKMSEEKIQENTNCNSHGHNKHLCHLMYEGFHFSKPEEYKQMVQEAQYRCQNCGRTAQKSESLCNPVSL
jgi:hypothetical protein